MSNRAEHGDCIVDDVAINRRLMINELRSGRHKQRIGGVGAWWEPNDYVCWYGLALRLFYPIPDDAKLWRCGYCPPDADDLISKKLGMSDWELSWFAGRNDDGDTTFNDLADLM
jgi:hypothetical protein